MAFKFPDPVKNIDGERAPLDSHGSELIARSSTETNLEEAAILGIFKHLGSALFRTSPVF